MLSKNAVFSAKIICAFATLMLAGSLSAIAKPTGCRAIFVDNSQALFFHSDVKRKGFVWKQERFTYTTTSGYRETATSGPTQLIVDQLGKPSQVCFWKDSCYKASTISLQGCRFVRVDSEMYDIEAEM